jgi:hypothetical protein
VRCHENVLSEKRGQESILDAALILPDSDQLLRSSGANGIAYAVHPISEDLLRKKEEIVNPKRIMANIGAPQLKFDFFGKGNRSLNRADG